MVTYWAAVTWFLQQWFSRTSSFLFASFLKWKSYFFIKNPTNTKFKKYFVKNHLNIFLAKIIVVNIPLDIFSVLVFIYIIFLKKKKKTAMIFNLWRLKSLEETPVKTTCEESMLERGDGAVDSEPYGDLSWREHGSLTQTWLLQRQIQFLRQDRKESMISHFSYLFHLPIGEFLLWCYFIIFFFSP